MDLSCDLLLGVEKRSSTQRTRIRTEAWFAGFAYCLRCSSDRVDPTRANTPACDFICPECEAPYELKSGAGAIGSKIVDGAFASMMQRIKQGNAPNLMLLRYTPEWKVQALTALHSVFVTPSIVERRAALGPTARRAGWVGCNLLLSGIPDEGKIPLIRNGTALERDAARAMYKQSERLTAISPEKRGWTALVLCAIRKISKAQFTLADVYSFERDMHAHYPDNSHIRAKIRQQLQVLRDLGYLEFTSRGEYRVLL